MKLTIIGPSYPFKSGISHFTTILVGKMRQQHEVDFINWKRQYPGFLYPVDPTDNDSKQTIEEPNVRIIDFYNPLSWIRAARRVRQHGSERIIITWVSMAQTPPYLGFLLANKMIARKPVTFLCHNVLPHDPYFFETPFIKLMFKLADDFIVHSTSEADDLSRLAPGKPVRRGFHPTYDEFNTEATYDVPKLKQELGLQEKVVLFFGFIRKAKGLKYLIEAMTEVAGQTDNKTSLLVVGEFWKKNKPEYDALVAKHGLEDRVVFVDRYIANEEIGKYFSVADVLAVPYTSATQSGVVQMGFAFDTPVVATRVGGLPEAIDEGKTGFLCEPADPKSLADTLVKALHYDDYDMSVAKVRFSWESYIDVTGLNETSRR